MKISQKIIAGATLLGLVAFSQIEARSETWNNIAALAGNNDILASSSKEVDSADWQYKKAWSSFLPQISLSAGYSENLSATTGEAKTYSYGVNASQSLFKGMQNYYGLKSAWANYQYTLASFNKTQSDVYYSLRSAFIALYSAQENLKLSEKILAQLKDNSRMIKLRYDSGREDRGNLMATIASEKDAEYGVSSAKRELELSRLKLSQLTNKDIKTVEGGLDAASGEAPDLGALTIQSPSYAMAQYQLEAADIAAQNTIGEFLPSISLSANYGKRGPVWPPEDENKSWSLNLSYPLFPGGANIANKMINDINLEAARRNFESTRKSVLYNIEDSYRKLKDANESFDVKRVYLDAARERAKIADAKYLNGLMTYDEWNRITNDSISAQKGIVSSEKSALLALAGYINSYGGR